MSIILTPTLGIDASMSSLYSPVVEESSFDPLSLPWAHAYWTEGPEFVALGLADGATVATWPDEIGSNDLTQGTAGFRPYYRAADAGYNNKPLVDSPLGDNNRSLRGVFTSTIPQPWDRWFVGEYGQNGAMGVDSVGGGFENICRVNSGTLGAAWALCFNDGGTQSQGGSTDFNKHLFRALARVSPTKDQWQIDGVVVIDADNGTNAHAGCSVFENSGGGIRTPGKVAFIGIAAAQLSASDADDLLAWAQSHYGTP